MVDQLKSRVFKLFQKYSLPRWFILLIDMAAVYVSFLIAYMLRFNFEIHSFDVGLAFTQGFIVLAVYTVSMLVFHSNTGMIRYTTLRDTYRIILTSFSAVTFLSIMTILSRNLAWDKLYNIPLSILVIHTGSVSLFLILFRIFVKLFYSFATFSSQNRRNILIYGSGQMGISLKRFIESDSKSRYRIKGFIDDDKKLQRKKVDGYPVYSCDVLTRKFFENEEIEIFIIAISKISPSRKREVIESVIGFGCEILDTPSVHNLFDGRFQISKLKKVNLDDLLGREPIKLNLERIERGLNGKTILVTGAAGSIGSEISRQLMQFMPKNLILLDQAETPSFFLGEELKSKYPSGNFRVIIGDVTNKEIMERVFQKYSPEIVFHAAAYKHVPIMEIHPHEAFRVNVGGTKIITELSVKYDIEKFVMVSSDKAVNPTNVMGATKKICELLVHATSRYPGIRTKFITTRFGNVLGSSGSVIPLFKRQIEQGGPITITHPEVTRFFMTIPEACQLVLEAGFMGNGGQIYVFDMGEQLKIVDIAINLIRLSGLVPYKDIKITFTGLRPGEKLFEELFSDNEKRLPTHHPKISIAEIGDIDEKCVMYKIETLLHSLYRTSEAELVKEMHSFVPGYQDVLITDSLAQGTISGLK